MTCRCPEYPAYGPLTAYMIKFPAGDQRGPAASLALSGTVSPVVRSRTYAWNWSPAYEADTYTRRPPSGETLGHRSCTLGDDGITFSSTPPAAATRHTASPLALCPTKYTQAPSAETSGSDSAVISPGLWVYFVGHSASGDAVWR